MSQSSTSTQTNAYKPWAARMWQGMLFGPYASLLVRNGFRISPSRWGLSFTSLCLSLFHSAMRPCEQLVYRGAMRRSKLEPPIFILGHWRSGTTMLHEMLVLDPRHTFPNTYECFSPNDFLLTERFFSKLKFLLPSQRPMDNMAAGWDRPQEDEFALCNMGIPSPYAWLAFPNQPPIGTEYLDFAGVGPAAIETWKQGVLDFLRRVAVRRPGRLVLKSPTHTGRIKVLLELFPDAKFVHIVRNPYAVFPSTMKLWKSLAMVQGLQVPRLEGLEEYVFNCFERMYRAFEAQQPLIPPQNYFEVRYEDLAADPLQQMESIYDQLTLGDFEAMRPQLEKYVSANKDYQKNRFDLAPALKAEIDRRWGPWMRQHGYCAEVAAS